VEGWGNVLNKKGEGDTNVTKLGTFFIFDLFMRVIAIRTLKTFWKTFPDAEGPLRSWQQEASKANWKNPAQLKIHFRNASILTNKRVVFNIKGNSYRLITDVEYRLQIIFIVWIGTHKKYNQIDAKTIGYDKTNKK